MFNSQKLKVLLIKIKDPTNKVNYVELGNYLKAYYSDVEMELQEENTLGSILYSFHVLDNEGDIVVGSGMISNHMPPKDDDYGLPETVREIIHSTYLEVLRFLDDINVDPRYKGSNILITVDMPEAGVVSIEISELIPEIEEKE